MAEKYTNGHQAGFAALGAETLGTVAELNQRVAQDLTRISLSAVNEGTRAVADLQQSTFDAWRHMQGAMGQWQMSWAEAFRDPIGWYQRALEHSVSTFHESINLGRRNAQTLIQACERMQGHSDEAARTLEQTFREGSSKIRDIQSRTEALRVA
jgi:hypothetical protein